MKKSVMVNIIGAGLGGLGCAAMLARKGINVRILEKQPQIGGVVGTFKRKGYRFEASTHQIALDGESYSKDLFHLAGLEGLEMIPQSYAFESFYIHDGKISERFLLPSGGEKFREALLAQFPGEAGHIDEYIKLLKRIWNDIVIRLGRLQTKDNLLPYLPDAIAALMLAKGKAGSFIQKFGARCYRGLTENFDRVQDKVLPFSDETLRSLMSQYWPYLDSPPSEASGVLFSLINYAFFIKTPFMVKGGSGVLIERLKKVITENGGEILCRKAVNRILMEDGRVTGAAVESGEVYPADFTVSAVSPYSTVVDLTGVEHFPEAYVKRIRESKLSCSAFQLYAGLPASLEEYGLKAPTNFFNYYKDQNKNYMVSCQGPSVDSPFIITDYTKENPSFAPPGGSSFVVIELDTYNRWKGLEGQGYKAQKQATEDILLDKITNLLGIPLREKAEVLFSATPLTMQRYMSNQAGEIYGYPGDLSNTLIRRLSHVSPLPNLFLAGGYTEPSMGFGATLGSGVQTGKILLGKL